MAALPLQRFREAVSNPRFHRDAWLNPRGDDPQSGPQCARGAIATTYSDKISFSTSINAVGAVTFGLWLASSS
jgi:hypothetical protein